MDKLLFRKRSIIEAVNEKIKNIAQIEHSRHRSLINAMVSITAALIAYGFQPKKPALKLDKGANMRRDNDSQLAFA